MNVLESLEIQRRQQRAAELVRREQEARIAAALRQQQLEASNNHGRGCQCQICAPDDEVER